MTNKQMKTPIEVEVAIFRKRDNAKAVTTVENSIKVCKIPFKTRSELFNKWINNRRPRRKVSPVTGALILNYFQEGGKWKKDEWTCKTELTLIEAENTALELKRPVT